MTNTIKDKMQLVAELRAAIKTERAQVKAAKIEVKQQKAQARAAKRAAKIEALELKLYQLKNPVGYKAIRAAKRPSKCIVTKFA